MSTEDQKKSVVTLKKGVDVDAFIEDMISGNNHNEFMPNRSVELYNEKADSISNVDFLLTKDEAATLKNDPRIVDVRYGTKTENGITLQLNSIEASRLYSKTATLDSTHNNWGIPACTSTTNPFVSTSLNYEHAYALTGNGVDVVIMDSGIDTTHPEWLNLAGTASRLQTINWPSASGLSETYTQSANHYTDTYGHGTHIAGIVAGRRYGWAKDANIYSITISDNSGNTFGISAALNMIKGWHNAKALQANGYKRPTVVMMAWSYTLTYAGITDGEYQPTNPEGTTAWTGTSPIPAYGMVQTVYNRTGTIGNYSYYHPLRVASVDSDIADCIAAGIIMIGAAGNESHKADIITNLDYNNFYNSSINGSTIYYHRGSTPGASDSVTCVGSVKYAQPEGKQFASVTGPRVDVFAPGDAIQSAIPTTSTLGTSTGTSAHPDFPAARVTKLSGSSIAAAQAAGIAACLVEARPNFQSAHVQSWFKAEASTGRLSDTGGTYTDTASLQGATNRFLYQPFNRSIVYSMSNS